MYILELEFDFKVYRVAKELYNIRIYYRFFSFKQICQRTYLHQIKYSKIISNTKKKKQ